MAVICYAFHLTPAEYRALTVAEHGAFTRLLKELEKRNRG